MSKSQSDASMSSRFGTLFANRRHYRGDCRLMCWAIRRGWLAEAPQADRIALLERFEAARASREASPSASGDIRAALAGGWVGIHLLRADDLLAFQAIQYSWAGKPTGRTTGRPRARWYVSDCAGRIDIRQIRREADSQGLDILGYTGGAIFVRPRDSTEGQGERVSLAISGAMNGRRAWRVLLVCPRCRSRREHLYPTTNGVKCRKCARIGYAPSRRRVP